MRHLAVVAAAAGRPWPRRRAAAAAAAARASRRLSRRWRFWRSTRGCAGEEPACQGRGCCCVPRPGGPHLSLQTCRPGEGGSRLGSVFTAAAHKLHPTQPTCPPAVEEGAEEEAQGEEAQEGEKVQEREEGEAEQAQAVVARPAQRQRQQRQQRQRQQRVRLSSSSDGRCACRMAATCRCLLCCKRRAGITRACQAGAGERS